MITSWKYFLVVAEELNISRAAKKLFISQQSLSQHIKRLENTYNAELFYRKPTFSLTPAGVSLFDLISKIQVLENTMTHELDLMRFDCNSAMTIGITNSRALIYMADVVAKFHELFPNVEINMPYSTSENLVSRLCRGVLDIYIGIGPIKGNGLDIIPLREEKAFLIVSENVLQKYGLLEVVVREFSFENRIDLHVLESIPYIANQPEELINSLYREYFVKEDIHLFSPFQSDSSQLRTKMCIKNLGMTLILEPMILYAIQYNAIPNQQNPLHIFQVEDFNVTSVLAYHKSAFLPHYMKAFINLVQEQTQQSTYEKYMQLYAPNP